MTPATTFAGRRIALFGLGGSGLATARALAAGGAQVICADDSTAALAKAAAEGLATADLTTLDWTGIAALVLSPGVPLTHKGGKPYTHPVVAKARAAGAEIIGDIELFCRERAKLAPHAPFVAITGTNGKSTTTALIAHILREAGRDVQMGGNIGRPILDLDPPSMDRVHVIECSSFQIDLAPSLAPTVGVLLNITPDHLDRHGTMEEYAAIKERLVNRSDFPVVAVDDELTRDVFARLHRQRHEKLAVSVQADVEYGYICSEGQISLRDSQLTFGWCSVPANGALRGLHNRQNVLAAVAAAMAILDNDWSSLETALRTFPGLPHRMEEAGRAGRVLFINDSKATNADSTEKALASFPSDIFWIVGGTMKEGGIAPLAPHFPRIAKAYLIGASTDAFAATLEGQAPFARAGTLGEALRQAAADAAASPAAEPVVLLSPACASYDQFRNFEERGDLFRALVQAMPGVAARTRSTP